MKAVHFGAGNIGRGFIGAVLQDAGFFVTFADVNQPLIDLMLAAGEYRLTVLTEQQTTRRYSNFTALHSVNQFDALVQAISVADLVTASVGANLLPKLAGAIAAGIKARGSREPLLVMACENAINATDILESAIAEQGELDYEKVIFANTAVDRIVPMQPEGSAPHVFVEEFCEWVIDSSRMSDSLISIPGAVFVKELAPFIERKLFTVNTAHLTIAYLGQLAGYQTIAQSLCDSNVFEMTRAVLDETSRVLIERHHFDTEQHEAYVLKTLARLGNPVIDDQVIRVGRQPLRKLSRNERLIGPAAYSAELGHEPKAILKVVLAALLFRDDSDSEVLELTEIIATHNVSDCVVKICGIDTSHPLYPNLLEVFSMHKSALNRA